MISLPNNNSASSSDVIDDSKSNNDLPALATCCNEAPNNFACVIAFAMFAGFAPKFALTVPVTLPVSSSISLKSN